MRRPAPLSPVQTFSLCILVIRCLMHFSYSVPETERSRHLPRLGLYRLCRAAQALQKTCGISLRVPLLAVPCTAQALKKVFLSHQCHTLVVSEWYPGARLPVWAHLSQKKSASDRSLKIVEMPGCPVRAEACAAGRVHRGAGYASDLRHVPTLLRPTLLRPTLLRQNY